MAHPFTLLDTCQASCPAPSSHEKKFRDRAEQAMRLPALFKMRTPHAAPSAGLSVPSTPATPRRSELQFFNRRTSHLKNRVPAKQTLHFSIHSGLVVQREELLPSHVTASRSEAASEPLSAVVCLKAE